jgi:hypothetical protein
MDPSRPYRPRVSRETRLLLTTALVAVATLWVLARIRFPDLPATPNPVAPLLSQLAITPTFDGLASEVAQLQARIEPSLVALEPSALVSADSADSPVRLLALRMRDDLAIALLPAVLPRAPAATDRVLGLDTASGLAVVHIAAGPAAPASVPWAPRRPERPRFLMVTDMPAERLALRPVFVTALEPIDSVVWSELIWAVPGPSTLVPGSFAFTTAGEFAGMVVEHGGRRAIVPAAIVLAAAERLIGRVTSPAGDVGIEVQALTPDVAAATGAGSGLVVTWVDPAGPAAGLVTVGDVIETAGGHPLPTLEHWRVRLARLGAGDTLSLGVRAGGKLRDIQMLAPAAARPPANGTALGMRLQRMSRAGSTVLGVDAGSAADRAGLEPGDLITSIGGQSSPTPLDVREAFAAALAGQPVLVGVTRGATHRVTTLSR